MTNNGLKTYIRQVAGGLQQNLLFNRIVVYQQNALPDGITVDEMVRQVEEKVPRMLLDDIDSIFVGQFPFLKEKEVDALYENGAIYVSNEQDNQEDFFSDIVHEIAHAVEETYPLDIYGDGTIEQEFLAKRRTMAEILHAHGYTEYGAEAYAETEYSPEFDSYLYREVGYDLLHTLLQGLFVSPYGATSLREYFANAFEEFFSGEPYYVKSLSPAVYKKLIDLQGY